MCVFGPEKAVKRDPFRPNVLQKELGKIQLPDAETEALVAIRNWFDLLKFDDPDAERLDVVDDLLRILVDVNLADVVVGCEIGFFSCHPTIGYLFPDEASENVGVFCCCEQHSLPLTRKSRITISLDLGIF